MAKWDWKCVIDNLEHQSVDPFIKHASLVFQQDGCTVDEARFKAWCEGPDGYAKRLEQEVSDTLKYVEEV